MGRRAALRHVDLLLGIDKIPCFFSEAVLKVQEVTFEVPRYAICGKNRNLAWKSIILKSADLLLERMEDEETAANKNRHLLSSQSR